MPFGLGNLTLLFGLAALAIPLVIHFLQRRRYDIVDWGAMQFLQVSTSVRRRWWWDDVLLLLLRMGLLAVLVLALASPFWRSASNDSPRDFVFVVDTSASMGTHDRMDRAKTWLATFVSRLGEEDRVAMVSAGKPAAIVQRLTTDHQALLVSFASLTPGGGADFAAALKLGQDLLTKEQDAPPGFVYLLKDNQRAGWTDDEALAQWERLAPTWASPGAPALHRVDLATEDPTGFNLWLSPLTGPAATVRPNEKITIRGYLHWRGIGKPPEMAQLVAKRDDVPFERMTLALDKADSPVAFSFSLRLDKPRRHLISVDLLLDADQANDILEDDRRHLVVEAAEALPVLLVDGEDKRSSADSTFFLHSALRDDGKTSSPFSPVVAGWRDLSVEALRGTAGEKPRVVVLADIPHLTGAQSRALKDYLHHGGAVLVILGPRVEPKAYAAIDWLPATLTEIEGVSGKLDGAASVALASLTHPALEYFRDPLRGLAQARFPRWFHLAPTKDAQTLATLDSAQPLLLEARVGAGRVLMCAVPLDRSWGGNFPTLHSYPIFVQQLILHLADAGASTWQVLPGETVRWQSPLGAKFDLPGVLFFRSPDAEAQPHAVSELPWIGPVLRRPGAYELRWGTEQRDWFVVPPDEREADPTPVDEEDEEKVAAPMPWTKATDPVPPAPAEQADTQRQHDLWWILLLVVVLFLFVELWFTRRLALKTAGAE